jgi:hypothetical protein
MVKEKFLSKKVVSRQVLKKNQMVATIPEVKAESNWGNSSTFFKQELEETKRSLFFS